MARKKTRPKKEAKRKKLNEIFSDEWIVERRKGLEKVESMNPGNVDVNFSYAAGMVLFYRCLGDIALEYVSKDIMSEVTRDAEKVINRIGYSMLKNVDVDRCLAGHAECRGFYRNPLHEKTVTCRCNCHSKAISRITAQESGQVA